MDLYLIRHADALALGERGITDDEQRPLSEKGEEQAAAMGRFFKARGMAFDRIVSSPLVAPAKPPSSCSKQAAWIWKSP